MKSDIPQLAKYQDFTAKGRKKIAEICGAAVKVFYEKGYFSATLEDVAAAIGGSKGAIYHYFSAKEDILLVILCRHLDEALERLEKKVESADTPHDQLYAFIESFIMNYQENQMESRLALNERGNLPQEYLDIIKSKERPFMLLLRTVIGNVLAEEERTPLNITVIAYSLMAMLSWPYRWFDPHGSVKPEGLARLIYKIIVGKIRLVTP